MRRPILSALLGSLAITSASAVEGGKQQGVAINCISIDDPLTKVSTTEMLGWLGSYSANWNLDDAFSIGAVGAQGRVFDPRGRLIHPAEMAGMIRSSPSFAGKKSKAVSLGVSDSSLGGKQSYAMRLERALGTKVSGCDADAYYVANGAMMCGARPIFSARSVEDRGRAMPFGFAPDGGFFVMIFCVKEKSAVDPRSMLTASVAFGLDAAEVEALESEAATQPEAAFRLYQFYWISQRNREKALVWLEKAAELGSDRARFNLAYELLESGDAKSKARAETLMADLQASGFAGPDLRRFYPAS